MGKAHLGALDLTVPCLATQVGGDLEHVGDTGRTDRVPLGDESTGHVHRRGAVTERSPGVDEVACATPLTQPQVVVVDQFGRGKAVVQLDQVEVLGADAGLLVGLAGGIASEGVHVWLDLAALHVRIGCEHRCGYPDSPLLGPLGHRTQALLRDQDGCGGTVAGRAAHQQSVRVALNR